MSRDERVRDLRWSRENSRSADAVDFLRRRGKLKEVLERRVHFFGNRKRLDFCYQNESAVTQNEIAVLAYPLCIPWRFPLSAPLRTLLRRNPPAYCSGRSSTFFPLFHLFYARPLAEVIRSIFLCARDKCESD